MQTLVLQTVNLIVAILLLSKRDPAFLNSTVRLIRYCFQFLFKTGQVNQPF